MFRRPLLRASRRATATARRGSSTSLSPTTTTHLETWIRENEASFAPPVMNKLMHRDQLSIMFVGGPNRREDFHLEEGSEFFYQLRGSMELPTVQAGRRTLVTIREGDVYLLPSRIPHSPQRKVGTFGLVIERKREPQELDGLRWYTDFEAPQKVLWDKFFYCDDLERDLVPVVKQYKGSAEAQDHVARDHVTPPAERPWEIDTEMAVPEPFDLAPWIDQHRSELVEQAEGASLSLFGDAHPDREFSVTVVGGPSFHAPPHAGGGRLGRPVVTRLRLGWAALAGACAIHRGSCIPRQH